MKEDARFIVGLGNPGTRYSRTRHNVGHLVVDILGRKHDCEPERRKFNALYRVTRWSGAGTALKVFFLKPQTYMNLSGHAVRSFLSYFGDWSPGETDDLTDRLLVIHDDLDLPLSKLRFRGQGTSGGHKGVQSIIQQVGAQAFSRLKIGIGRADGGEASEYVLERVQQSEWEAITRAAETAADTVGVWIDEGIESCMNRFNAAQ